MASSARSSGIAKIVRISEGRAVRDLYQRRFTREKSIGEFVKLIEEVAGR